MHFKQGSLTSDIILWTEDGKGNIFIFLIKRKNEPFKNMLALPGGFVEIDTETFKQAAIRELFEETNIKTDDLDDYDIIMDSPKRDPRCRVISKVFSKRLNEDEITKLKAKDDATEIVKVNIEDICNNKIKLAFDHSEAIDMFMISAFQL